VGCAASSTSTRPKLDELIVRVMKFVFLIDLKLSKNFNTAVKKTILGLALTCFQTTGPG